MKKLHLSVLSVLFIIAYSNAADFYAIANGDWKSKTTWSPTSGGSSGTSTPGSGDNIFIEGGFTVTISTNELCANVTVGTGTIGILTFSAASDRSLGISGALSINSGSTINVSNSGPGNTIYSISLQGNLTNNGTLACVSPDLSDVLNFAFAGTSAQSIGGSSVSGFNNLSINKPSGELTLNQSVTVTNLFSLLGGKVNLQTNFLTLTGAVAATQLSGGNSSNYIYSTGTGRLRRNNLLASSGYITFPVGTSANYLPVDIRHNDATPADFAVNVFSPATTNGVEGGPAFSNTSDIVNAVWNIDRIGGIATADNTRIHWDDALEGSNFSSFTDGQIGISHYVGVWQTATALSASQSGNTVEELFSSFSPFAVIQLGTTLPVKFGSFKAYEKQNGIQLEWKVYTEDKVKEYVIERAADARSFHGIGSTPAVFNTVGSGDYGFFDTDPLPGRSFYRLKNVDIDGKSSYSPVIMVNRDKSVKGLRLYPNPVSNGIIALQGSDLVKGMYKLTVLNTAGQEIQTQYFNHSGGTISQTFDISAKLGKGIYLLVVKDEDGNQLMKEKFVNQ